MDCSTAGYFKNHCSLNRGSIGTSGSTITWGYVAAAIAQVETALAGEGRLLIRYSGTEPLLRVMIEGKDETQIAAWAQSITDRVREALT